MRLVLVSLFICLGCPASTDPETFAANWIRDLAEGRTDRAYEQLCLDAKEQLSSLGLKATKEAPQVFLKRLAGRYGGIDSMAIRQTHRDYIDLEINTSRARLPLRLRRQQSGWCVTLPDPN